MQYVCIILGDDPPSWKDFRPASLPSGYTVSANAFRLRRRLL